MVAMAKRMIGGTVTYGVLASILSGAASLYVFLAHAHDVEGHERHHEEASAVEQRTRDAMKEHEGHTEARLQTAEARALRVEVKLDWMLEHQGFGFPPDAPRLPQKPDGGSDGGP